MNPSVGIASVLLGLSVALAVPVGPAAAGKDSNRTTAEAHTQGRSLSDPDGLSNGGADKPGHTGGFTSDRDGNNGCGNDDDREDDNNGWCGQRPDKKAQPADSAAAPAAGDVAASAAGTTVDATVLGATEVAPASAESAGASDPSDAEVLGAQEERGASGGPASLPRTGAGVLLTALAGAALAGGGATLRRFSRRG